MKLFMSSQSRGRKPYVRHKKTYRRHRRDDRKRKGGANSGDGSSSGEYCITAEGGKMDPARVGPYTVSRCIGKGLHELKNRCFEDGQY